MDKTHLNSLETKEAVINYAESLGITTLTTRRSLSNLKSDVITKFNHKMSEAVAAVNTVSTTPIEGERLITVIKANEPIDVIPFSALEQYCQSQHIPYDSVKNIVGMTWLNVHGYSFKEGM